MRVMLFALMIALMPLRGWMGDAMATSMAAAQLHSHTGSHNGSHMDGSGDSRDAIESIATQAANPRASDGFDAEKDVSTAPQAQTDADLMSDCANHVSPADDTGKHCPPTCSACAACHAAAMTSPAPRVASSFSPSVAPLFASRHFASADTKASQKPPIS